MKEGEPLKTSETTPNSLKKQLLGKLPEEMLELTLGNNGFISRCNQLNIPDAVIEPLFKPLLEDIQETPNSSLERETLENSLSGFINYCLTIPSAETFQSLLKQASKNCVEMNTSNMSFSEQRNFSTKLFNFINICGLPPDKLIDVLKRISLEELRKDFESFYKEDKKFQEDKKEKEIRDFLHNHNVTENFAEVMSIMEKRKKLSGFQKNVVDREILEYIELTNTEKPSFYDYPARIAIIANGQQTIYGALRVSEPEKGNKDYYLTLALIEADKIKVFKLPHEGIRNKFQRDERPDLENHTKTDYQLKDKNHLKIILYNKNPKEADHICYQVNLRNGKIKRQEKGKTAKGKARSYLVYDEKTEINEETTYGKYEPCYTEFDGKKYYRYTAKTLRTFFEPYQWSDLDFVNRAETIKIYRMDHFL